MSVIDFDRCYCSCHTQAGVMHMVACCGACRYCGKDRIPRDFVRIHEDKCPSNPKNQPPASEQ